MTRPPIQRFVEKFEIDPVTLCWVWRGARFDNGYGAFWFDGSTGQAHRFAYAYFTGPIPPGFEIDHLCRNRACASPDHLEAVTHAVNVQRGEVGLRERSKTHCPQGHSYDPANTWVSKEGFRVCRACHRVRERERRAAVAA